MSSSPPAPTTVPAAATDPSLHLSASSSSSTTTTLTTASETGAAGTAAGTAAAAGKQPPEDLEMERREIPTQAAASPLDPVPAASDTAPAQPAAEDNGRVLPPAAETLQETALQQQQQPTIRPVGISAAELVSREVLAQKEEAEAQEELDEEKGETTTSTSSDLQPFVNTGLLTWEKIRHAWLGGNTPTVSSSSGSDDATAIPLEVDEIIDVIFASPRQGDKGGPRNFPQAVPLPQMVDILQDLWEAEGLDI